MPAREVQKTTTYRESAVPEERRLIDYNVAPRRPVAAAVVYYLLDIIEIILGLRLIFRLLGANPNNGLVNFLYTVSAPLIAPFTGIFRQPVVAGSVLEWSTVIAMIIYAIVAYLIVQLIRLSYRQTV